MSKLTKVQQAERAAAVERLRELLPVGAEVPVVLEHVSRSGMLRSIKVYAPVAGGGVQHISHDVATVTGWGRRGNRDGVTVQGCGMDMGFHLVYTLAYYLHGDGYALKSRWL